jgi:hypothetical protein
MDIFNLAKLKGYEGENKIQDIQEWLRIKKYIHPEIFFSTYHSKFQINNFFVDVKKNKKINRKETRIQMFTSFEDARDCAIEEILNNLI